MRKFVILFIFISLLLPNLSYAACQINYWPTIETNVTPKFIICDTEAEIPTSGLTEGDRIYAKDTDKVYTALTETTYIAIKAGDVEGVDYGTMTDTRLCTYDSASTEIDCDTVAGSGDVLSSGDCVSDACGDGTSDGGTYYRLYDGDSHYGQFGVLNLSGNRTYSAPNVTGTIVLDTATQTLTNKTLSASNNVIEADNVKDLDFGDVTVSSGDWAVEDNSHTHDATTLSTDSVSADELNATGVEAELEAVQDLQDFQGAVTDGQVPDTITTPMPRGHIWGLTMSNAADTANDITVAVGEARNSTNSDNLILTGNITKRLDAGWVVGDAQGGLNTGAEANSTWYEVHLIKRTDTNVVDVMFTTTANRATLPTSYTVQRQIGWIRNDGAGAILQFTQIDDHFTLTTQVNDSSTACSATAAAVTVTAPPSSIARFRAGIDSTTSVNANTGMVFSEIVEGNVTPALTTGILSLGMWDLATGASGGHYELRVSSSSTIEFDCAVATGTFDISTFGWIDMRGRLSGT